MTAAAAWATVSCELTTGQVIDKRQHRGAVTSSLRGEICKQSWGVTRGRRALLVSIWTRSLVVALRKPEGLFLIYWLHGPVDSGTEDRIRARERFECQSATFFCTHEQTGGDKCLRQLY